MTKTVASLVEDVMMHVRITQSSTMGESRSLFRASASSADYAFLYVQMMQFVKMIKKLLIIVFLVMFTQTLFGELQFSYNLTCDPNCGTDHRIASYATSLSRSWLFENIIFASYNGKKAEGTSETPSTDHYLLNYLRDKVSISYFNEDIIFNFFLAGEYDFGENFKTNIAGLPYQFVLKNGISSGLNAKITTASLTTDLNISYDTKQFDYDEEGKKRVYTESNILGELRTGISISQPLEIYADVFHYDDLNESDLFDYSSVYGGVRFDKKLNYIHYFTMDAAAGYCNVDSLIPYTLRIDARLTSKLVHNWMFVTRMAYNIWTDDEFDNVYGGNNFGEITLQKNFSFNPRNQVNNFQCSVAHFYLDNNTLLKSNIKWHFGNLICESWYRHYFGAEVPYRNEVKAQVAYQFSRNLRLSYSYDYRDYTLIPNKNAHSIGLDILL